MKLVLLLALCLTLAVTHEEVFSRENEPDPREYEPFKMPAMIKHVCESLRWFLETQQQNRPRNALQLSETFVREFDRDEDSCISGNEIRDIAARFRGNVAGYRTIFQHVLDENRSGCVEAGELNSLVLDCIMPSATWMKQMPEEQRFSSSFDKEEAARIFQEPEQVEDVVLGEVEEEQVVMMPEDTLEMSPEERESEDRRVFIEESAPESTGLNEAVKEMICSLIRREHHDAEFGLRSLAEIVDTDQAEGLSFDEVFEFLSGARIPREETDDLAVIMDSDSDGVVSVEELLTAVDRCPEPEWVAPAEVTNNRPRTNFDEVECSTPEQMYKELRTRAMKFLGSRQITFDGAMEAAAELYATITGDIEEVIEPSDLDVPLHCVKEMWQDIDADRNGFLDLHEFNNIALDLFEEFLPKPVKQNRRIQPQEPSVRIEDLDGAPRSEADTLADIILQICREGGLSIQEDEVERVVGIVLQDRGVSAILDKLLMTGTISERAQQRLASMVRPIVYQLFSE